MKRRISRRIVLSWLAGAGASAAIPAVAEQEKPADRGIGGTGISAEPDIRERRIGYIGAIQRFGSIFVNDSRISYSKDVPVWVDGQRATASRLAIGQVVRVVAEEGDGGGLATRRIEVLSEVIGPITSLSDAGFIVLGQTVLPLDDKRPSWWQPGARVAVSGFRSPDGSIVATRIEPAGSRPDQVVGVPHVQGWNLQIGDQQLLGIGPQYGGWRVIVRGRATPAGLVVSRVQVDAPFAGADVGRLSIETVIQNQGGDVLSGLGIALGGLGSPPPGDGWRDRRAVLGINVEPSGELVIDRLTVSGGASVPIGTRIGPSDGGPSARRGGLGKLPTIANQNSLRGAVGLGGPSAPASLSDGGPGPSGGALPRPGEGGLAPGDHGSPGNGVGPSRSGH